MGREISLIAFLDEVVSRNTQHYKKDFELDAQKLRDALNSPYMDEWILGKETLDTRTRSVSKGRSGSSSVNYQQTGRELMTPDEVRALDNDHCILFIRGELPVMDRKYDILKHPGLKLTEDGGAAPYIHRPGLTYALEDLPLSTDSWESIEIIE